MLEEGFGFDDADVVVEDGDAQVEKLFFGFLLERWCKIGKEDGAAGDESDLFGGFALGSEGKVALVVEIGCQCACDLDCTAVAAADDDGRCSFELAVEAMERFGGVEVRAMKREEIGMGGSPRTDDQGVVV